MSVDDVVADAPPSYERAKTGIARDSMSDESDASRASVVEEVGTRVDELGLEVRDRDADAHDARARERASARIGQMERTEAYMRASGDARAAGADVSAALALTGVHPNHRAEIWAERLNAHVREYSSDSSYQQYLDAAREALSEREIDLIEGDARAVRAAHPHLREAEATSASGEATFGERNDAFRGVSQKLTRILIAASARSTQGYCAGFAVPALVMLLITKYDEEAAFWMLVGLIEDVVASVVSKSGIKLYAEAKYIDMEIKLLEPELAERFRAADCRPSVVAAGVLTRLGLGVLPTETTLRLFDALILEGGQVLAPFVAQLLMSMKGTLLACDPARMCDAFDAEAGKLFDIDDILKSAIGVSRGLKSNFDSLSIRRGEREVAADALYTFYNFRETVNALSRSIGPEGIGRQETIARAELEIILRLTYALEEFADVDSAVEKEYQTRELLNAFDLGVRHKDDKTDSLRFDEIMKVLRVKSSTSSKLKMLNVPGETVDERVRNFILGDANAAAPSEKSLKVALMVANGVVPTQRSSSAPVESAILMELAKKPNWYGEMRTDARSALILTSFSIPLFLGGATSGEESYDVSIVASRSKTFEDSPRALGGFGSLPHTEYYLLVQTSVGPQIVKKRYSDFKALHESLLRGGCFNVMRLPRDGAVGTDAALSVDPHVVATRSVSLQRYLDQISACGLHKVRRTARAFLGLEAPAPKRLRDVCADACSPSVRCDFFGLARRKG